MCGREPGRQRGSVPVVPSNYFLHEIPQTTSQINLQSCSNRTPKDDLERGPTAWRWACLGRKQAAAPLGGRLGTLRYPRGGWAAAERAGADGKGRGSGCGHAVRGLGLRSQVGGRQKGRSLDPPGPGAPQPCLYPGLHHRPLCVPAPAPEAPQPVALSSLIGSTDGFIDWLPSRPAWYASYRFHWSPELPLRPSREVIAWLLGVPGSSSGKPRVLPGSRLCP